MTQFIRITDDKIINATKDAAGLYRDSNGVIITGFLNLKVLEPVEPLKPHVEPYDHLDNEKLLEAYAKAYMGMRSDKPDWQKTRALKKAMLERMEHGW